MKQLSQNKQKMFFSVPKDNIIYDSDGNKIINHLGDYLATYNPNAPGITEDLFARDLDGNIVYTSYNGVEYPVLSETKDNYCPPEIFYANISFNSGETVQAEFGLDTSDYDAIISADKGYYPFNIFTEQTLIWHESVPKIDDYGQAIIESAEYRIVAIKTSLNEQRFILKKRVEDV